MKLAFLGLGNMGTPMARNLLRTGQDVAVWNRTQVKAEELRADGGKVAGSIADATRGCDIAITMLADDAAVASVVVGPGGVLETLAPGAIHVSMSTISVALSQQLAGAHQPRGQHYVAAPVFGRPEAAAAAKLFIAAAGDADALKRCQAVFDAIGQRTFVIGPKPEMANVVKLTGNFLIASVVESLGEAVALTRKYGIDPHEYVEFLTSTLFAAPVYKTYGGIIADAVDAPLPVASVVRDHMLAAIGRGMDDLDWSSLARLAAENAGLK
jgi:3-hydroxyisobutyrate dehydrogenase-like beta-hydroxyacid dehydrogenase